MGEALYIEYMLVVSTFPIVNMLGKICLHFRVPVMCWEVLDENAASNCLEWMFLVVSFLLDHDRRKTFEISLYSYDTRRALHQSSIQQR